MDPVTLCMLPHFSVSQAGQTLCTSNVAACNQLLTQLVISQQIYLHPALPILAEFALCAATHVIVCILVDSVLCSMSFALARDVSSHTRKACGCQVVHCLPGLQMTMTTGMVSTTTMTTSVATTVMSMATTSALVDLLQLQQPLADVSFRQSIIMATTTTMREVLLLLLQLHQVAMVHLLLQLPRQVQAGLPEHWLYDCLSTLLVCLQQVM